MIAVLIIFIYLFLQWEGLGVGGKGGKETVLSWLIMVVFNWVFEESEICTLA